MKKGIGNFLVCVLLVISCVVVCVALYFAVKEQPVPLKFESEIISAAKEFELEESMVATICLIESSFRPQVVSSKGAVGLMQIMPTTAVWIAGKKGISTFKLKNLSNPQTNIYLGSAYLRYLIDKFQDENTAVCAYNAGEGNVSAWLINSKYSDDKKTLKAIPFHETKNYIYRYQKYEPKMQKQILKYKKTHIKDIKMIK